MRVENHTIKGEGLRVNSRKKKQGGLQMGKKRQTFSKDFKAKVVLEALREESTIQEIAAKHGVHPNQISQWKSLAIAGMADLFERPNKKSQKVRQQEEIVGVGNNCCGVNEFINH